MRVGHRIKLRIRLNFRGLRLILGLEVRVKPNSELNPMPML